MNNENKLDFILAAIADTVIFVLIFIGLYVAIDCARIPIVYKILVIAVYLLMLILVHIEIYKKSIFLINKLRVKKQR